MRNAVASVFRVEPETHIANAKPHELALDGGERALVKEGALEVRDGENRLLLRYERGALTIGPEQGDLRLVAPHGAVLVSGSDVRIEATRDVCVDAPRSVTLRAGSEKAQATLALGPHSIQADADRVGLKARLTEVALGSVSLVAGLISTTAERILQNSEEHTVDAKRLVMRAETALHSARDLLETRAGRARTLIAGAFDVHSERTSLVSEKETSIDGDRVLLG